MEGAGLSELRTEQTILSLLRRVEELRIDVKYWNRVHKAKRWLERSLGGWAGVWHEVVLLSKRCGVLNGLFMRSILLWGRSDADKAYALKVSDKQQRQRARRKLQTCNWALLDFLDFRCPDPNPTDWCARCR